MDVGELNLRGPLTVADASQVRAAIAAQRTLEFAIFEDQKSGDGGTFVQGAWRTRDLNTTLQGQSWASLNNDQITLAAGTYLISGRAPGYAVQSHLAKFAHISGSGGADILGTDEYGSSTHFVSNHSFFENVLTLLGSNVFEVQHWCASTNTGNGFGQGDTGSAAGVNSVFTHVKIMRLS